MEATQSTVASPEGEPVVDDGTSTLSDDHSVSGLPDKISKKEFKASVFDKLRKWRDGVDFGGCPPIAGIDDWVFNISTEEVCFPTVLSPSQRRIVHQIALRLDLYHASCGDGADRFVIVSKTGRFKGLKASVSSNTSQWYNTQVSKPQLHAKFFEMQPSDRTRVRSLTKELQDIIDDTANAVDGDELALMAQTPNTLADIAPPTAEECIVVNTVESLDNLRKVLEGASEFAFDVEMHNFRSYYGMTCCIQLSVHKLNYVIDTLALWEHIPSLCGVFSDTGIVKVGHAIGGGDVPALFRDFAIVIVNAVDTQDMAAALGKKNAGLASLLVEYGCPCGDEIKQSKPTMQSMDWRTRPYTDAMIRYAALDVHYLLPLYTILKKKILTMGCEDEDEYDLSVEEIPSVPSPAHAPPGSNGSVPALEPVVEEDDVMDMDADKWSEDEDLTHDIPDQTEEDLDMDEDEDDEAMWEGWGGIPAAEAAESKEIPASEPLTPMLATLTVDTDTQTESLSNEELIKIRADKSRGDSFSAHVLQPKKEAKGPSTPVHTPTHTPSHTPTRLVRCKVTPEGVDVFRRVYRNTAKSCIKLWRPKDSNPNPNAYLRVKGLAEAKKLKGWQDVNTFVFKELFKWRETTAKQKDESPVYICPSDILIAIAFRCPRTAEDLKKITLPLPPFIGAPENTREILQVIEEAKRTWESGNLRSPTFGVSMHVLWVGFGVAVVGLAAVAIWRSKVRW